jgi:uncharacterized Zn-binding protein involved in type VI secretion
MRTAAIRHGDPTTTGGVVLGGSSTMFDDGRHIALSGDEATCGVCQGKHRIIGTADRMTEGNRAVVVEGDRLACPCGKNHVMIGANPGVFIHIETDGAPYTRYADTQGDDEAESAANWISFNLTERGSCEGFSCVAHFADGTFERASINANNRVRFTRDSASACRYIAFFNIESKPASASVAEALLTLLRCER